MKRLLLNEEDFEKLTKGEVIQKDDVQIALSDIGFDNMINIVERNRVMKNIQYIFDSESRDIESLIKNLKKE